MLLSRKENEVTDMHQAVTVYTAHAVPVYTTSFSSSSIT